MSGNFNAQILVDKLAKLNNTQQSIETLSHWCIFHRKKAKHVVETWERQFHCSPQDQRVPYLYLANDILQNSRRKGSEFVVEFWKVLPDALNDVIENGGESGRNAALRLVGIWEERKVFGSRGHILKEELLGRNQESHNRNGKVSSSKLKQPVGDELEKLISSYEHVYDSSVDEDAVLSKCHTAISCIEKVEKEIGTDLNSAIISRSEAIGDLQGQHDILRECIEQLKAAEMSRTVLVSNLREALRDQELKLEQVHNQLQVVQARSELAGNICEQLMNRSNGQLLPEQRPNETPAFTEMPPSFGAESQATIGEKDMPTPVMFSQQGSLANNHPQTEDENRKTAAAAVAAKLAASTASAEVLSLVFSTLASDSVIVQQTMENHLSDSNKRPRFENNMPYMPPNLQQATPPPFPHPNSLQQMSATQPPPLQPSSPMSHPSTTMQGLQLPVSLPPLQPPLHPNQLMQSAGSMTGVPYSYGTATPQRPPPLPVNYSMAGMPPYPGPTNAYPNVQVSEGGGFFSQPPVSVTSPPVPRQ